MICASTHSASLTGSLGQIKNKERSSSVRMVVFCYVMHHVTPIATGQTPHMPMSCHASRHTSRVMSCVTSHVTCHVTSRVTSCHASRHASWHAHCDWIDTPHAYVTSCVMSCVTSRGTLHATSCIMRLDRHHTCLCHIMHHLASRLWSFCVVHADRKTDRHNFQNVEPTGRSAAGLVKSN
jgi:hypothetical protein